MIGEKINESESILAARTLFITGTDTGVGKTFVSCLILRHLRERGLNAIGFKPICCGDRDDAAALAEAGGIGDIDTINPVWFESPLAPLVAAKREGRTLDRCAIIDNYKALCSTHDWVIIEGAGGWEVPLSERETMADLALEFAAPVLVVAANRLGVLNHTLLTCQAIDRRGLSSAGVVLNSVSFPDTEDLAVQSNRETLQAVLPKIPVIEIEFGAVDLRKEFAAILED